MTKLRLLIMATITTFATDRIVLVKGWMLADHRRRSLWHPISSFSSSSTTTTTSLLSEAIDYQSSESFGRGEDHLSAFLQEGDVVVYQAGTWMVDGVQVGNANDDGDSDTPSFRWAIIDTMQVVWTHNCEHGVLRGIALYEDYDDEEDNKKEKVVGTVTEGWVRRLKASYPLEFVEFGPEQLVARVPFSWDSHEQLSGITTVSVKDWEPL